MTSPLAVSQLLGPEPAQLLPRPPVFRPAPTVSGEGWLHSSQAPPPLLPLPPPTTSYSLQEAAPRPRSDSPPRSHATTTSLYQCADCLRRYSRPEHLQRHIATHTLGKRFTCDVCGKAFGRADLLKRHRSNHNDSDGGTKKRRLHSSPAAARVAHACLACAKARVKCEESKPCTRCQTRSISCEYATAEAGSAAAMHLLHLSANPHLPSRPDTEPSSSHQSSTDSSPRSCRNENTGGPSPLSYPQGKAASSVVPRAPSATAEEAQLPTPETMDQTDHTNGYHPFPNHLIGDPSHGMAGLDFPFTGFLRDVIYPFSDQARLAEPRGSAILDFGGDTSLDLSDIDFGVLNNWSADGLLDEAMNVQAPSGFEDSADMSKMRQKLAEVWTQSPWRWNPKKQDSGYGEQNNLPVPSAEVGSQFPHGRQSLDRVVQDRLDHSGRDQILALVLGTCRKDNGMMARVVSSFPSTEALDSLIHVFLASHLCQVSEWIDYSGFDLNEQWPDWLASAAAAGAVLTPNSALRKFGFALQEAVRLSIPFRFENNNSNVTAMGLVQAVVLGQDIGLWSGNRRKMEIAECHLDIPITMMRYRGRFQRSQYPAIPISPSDSAAELERKWAQWREREAWKRLAFHCYLRDAQASITTLTPPRMSYTELTLPLPESRRLWFARSAEEWQMYYREINARDGSKPPSLGDLFRDINTLVASHGRLDVQLAISIYLHGFWSLIWDFRQLHSIHRPDTFSPGPTGQNPNILLGSRRQELVRLLQHFETVTAGWHELSAQERLVLNTLQMNLHVSLDDLQLFSGKDGEEEARRIYPTLQEWCDGPDSRQAVWHAGQVLALAKLFPPGHLKDFYAVAVHHAALALWTWGVVRKAMRKPSTAGHGFVFLDGPEAGWAGLGEGEPVIRGPLRADGEATTATLEDPRSCMEVAQEILRANFGGARDALPPIVENLCLLIKQLGNAAWAVGLG